MRWAPAAIAMQYRSQSGVGPPAKLARRLLRTMPEAQAMGMGCEGGQAGGRRALKALRRRSGVRKRPYGEGDTNHQQQELFVMVAARLAADQVFRAGIRRDRHRAG